MTKEMKGHEIFPIWLGRKTFHTEIVGTGGGKKEKSKDKSTSHVGV